MNKQDTPLNYIIIPSLVDSVCMSNSFHSLLEVGFSSLHRPITYSRFFCALDLFWHWSQAKSNVWMKADVLIKKEGRLQLPLQQPCEDLLALLKNWFEVNLKPCQNKAQDCDRNIYVSLAAHLEWVVLEVAEKTSVVHQNRQSPTVNGDSKGCQDR